MPLFVTVLCLTFALLMVFIARLQHKLMLANRHRASERNGRIKAEVALRAALDAQGSRSQRSTEFFQIGVIDSCYQQRNGTPRQALLVPEARARLVFHSDIPHVSYEDLKGFSHLWIIYAFHKNTNLHQRLRGKGFKAKVRMPRLDRKKISVFATRSPHRFNNIGLSVAKILQVNAGCIHLGGIDMIDGTPVLDIKPYVPSYDAVLDAQLPEWLPIEKKTVDEPLHVAKVSTPTILRERMRDFWKESHQTGQTRFGTFDEYYTCVEGSLYRDIRSAYRRLNDSCYGAQNTVYRFVVDKTVVSYVIDDQKRVSVIDIHKFDGHVGFKNFQNGVQI